MGAVHQTPTYESFVWPSDARFFIAPHMGNIPTFMGDMTEWDQRRAHARPVARAANPTPTDQDVDELTRRFASLTLNDHNVMAIVQHRRLFRTDNTPPMQTETGREGAQAAERLLRPPS
jgi:hypothetical protein